MASDAVVCGRDHDRGSVDRGVGPTGDACQPDDEVLEAAQAARWLRQVVEPRPGLRHRVLVERAELARIGARIRSRRTALPSRLRSGP